MRNGLAACLEARRESAVGVDELAGDPAALVGDEERDDCGDVSRCSQPSEGVRRGQCGTKIVVHPPGVDGARVDGVR